MKMLSFFTPQPFVPLCGFIISDFNTKNHQMYIDFYVSKFKLKR